jgi:hypothetical protein
MKTTFTSFWNAYSTSEFAIPHLEEQVKANTNKEKLNNEQKIMWYYFWGRMQ